jgi:plastocyanin
MIVRRALFLGAAPCAAVLLMGCGSASTNSGSTGTPAAACSGSAAVTGLGTPTTTIDATDALVFDPSSATTQVGDVLEFKNTGSVEHTVTFQDASDGCLTDATLDPGSTWQVKFTQPGTYNYLCTIHAPNMKGTITVTG